MKILSAALPAAALLAATTASAQTTFKLGLRGGANRATTALEGASNSVGYATYSTEKSSINAWQAGIVLEARFGKLAFQPALLFSQKGEKVQASSAFSGFEGDRYYRAITSTNRYNWLELPLNVVYTLRTDHGLQVFAGPYVAAAVGGRQRGTETSYSSFLGVMNDPYSTDFSTAVDYGSGTPNKRWDVGFNFGIGYRQGPLQMQLGFGLGLLNLHPPGGGPIYSDHNFNADPAYNRVAQLTATYFVAH